jgi:arginyl-tRNA synthetase
MAQHEEMRNTVFGEVLAELLEKRGLEVTPFAVGKLGEQSGLDGWKVIGRMADADAGDPGDLDGLAAALELTRVEMVRLAVAYAFEQRAEEVITLPT